MVCYTTRSDVHFPITAGIFLEHLTSFIELDLLNPFYYVTISDEHFSIYKWLVGLPWSYVKMDKDQDKSYFDDYALYYFWGILIFSIFWIFKVVKRKTKQK